MVVFAVMVALAVEGWSEDRQMREFADRARQGVITEIRANLDDFRQNGPGLLDTEATLWEVIREEERRSTAGWRS
jgi:hypothetical protein